MNMNKSIKPIPYYNLYALDAEREDAAWLRRKFNLGVKRKLKGVMMGGFSQQFLLDYVAANKVDYPYFVRCDIRQYYPNIQHDILAGTLCEAYAGLHNLLYVPKPFKHRVLKIVASFLRRMPMHKGLPLANPLSSIIAQCILLPVWLEIKKKFNVPFVVFMDDMLFFTRNQSEREYLWQYINNKLHNNYQLELNLQKCTSGRFGNTSFDFCGWDFAGGYTRISETKLMLFKQRMLETFKKLKSQDNLRACIKLVNRKIDGFGNYYKHGHVCRQFQILDKWIRAELKKQIQACGYAKRLHTLQDFTGLGLHSLETCYRRLKTKMDASRYSNCVKVITPPMALHAVKPGLADSGLASREILQAILEELKTLNRDNKHIQTSIKQIGSCLNFIA